MSSQSLPPLDLASLSARYADGSLTPSDLVPRLDEAARRTDERGIFIQRVPSDELARAATALEARRARGEVLPLYGVPFAVKDNIDVAGLPTTAACPAYAARAQASAPVVDRLLDAGALFVGKTNLDQFATGLVGVRSPYGVPPNPFDERYISGGSSSGSAAAVARGLVSFALGTDTAGSGRVPAAFTNIVGLKPSGGLFSTRGVVPACRSLDCVSVFALTVADAGAVGQVMAAYDAQDPFSRPEADGFAFGAAAPARFRCGVLPPSAREFHGDAAAAAAYQAALERLAGLGAVFSEVDFAPFLEAAALLYDGPYIAERLAGLESFVDRRPDAILPVTLEILQGGRSYRGTDVFRGQHRLQALRQVARAVFRDIDTFVVPTAPTIYRQDEVAAEPRVLNARLGRYVNFVNLLGLAGVAVPNGFRPDRLPTGITLVGPWGSDARLLALAAAYHASVGGTLGATPWPLPATPAPAVGGDVIPVAVAGAHLSGMPLNHQLTERGGRLLATTRTAPLYRLYALPGTTPPKPGLVRVAEGGQAIELEVWGLPTAALGGFLAGVSAPLGLGRVSLDDGSNVIGFLCEAYATQGAEDISHFGGWRRYRGAVS